jgi:hypothetical protein
MIRIEDMATGRETKTMSELEFLSYLDHFKRSGTLDQIVAQSIFCEESTLDGNKVEKITPDCTIADLVSASLVDVRDDQGQDFDLLAALTEDERQRVTNMLPDGELEKVMQLYEAQKAEPVISDADFKIANGSDFSAMTDLLLKKSAEINSQTATAPKREDQIKEAQEKSLIEGANTASDAELESLLRHKGMLRHRDTLTY